MFAQNSVTRENYCKRKLERIETVILCFYNISFFAFIFCWILSPMCACLALDTLSLLELNWLRSEKNNNYCYFSSCITFLKRINDILLSFR
jgi:hypothetical protein